MLKLVTELVEADGIILCDDDIIVLEKFGLLAVDVSIYVDLTELSYKSQMKLLKPIEEWTKISWFVKMGEDIILPLKSRLSGYRGEQVSCYKIYTLLDKLEKLLESPYNEVDIYEFIHNFDEQEVKAISYIKFGRVMNVELLFSNLLKEYKYLE